MANPTLRCNRAKPKANTKLQDLSHTTHVDTKAASMTHTMPDRHQVNNGHHTTLMATNGNMMGAQDGTKTNWDQSWSKQKKIGTARGSLPSLKKGYPTDLMMTQVQASTLLSHWFLTPLNNLEVILLSLVGLTAWQQAHGCFNNFLAPFVKSSHGR